MRRFAVLVAVVLAATVVPVVLSPTAALAARPNAAQRIADINPGTGAGSSPQFLTRFGDIALFQADDGTHGTELWMTDGTTAGTELLKDIHPGAGGSNPQNFTVFGTIVLFTADDGTTGPELWKTDGSTSGTVRVKDINPGAEGAFSTTTPDPDFKVFGPMVLFAADDGATGTELWRTDGTASGTTLVADIEPGNPSFPHDITPFGSVALFVAQEDTHGVELWKTDGTGANTVIVKDLFAGSISSDPKEITPLGAIALFSANDGSASDELFKTDGTATGTTLVKDIQASGSSDPSRLTAFGGIVLFNANQSGSGSELWKSDGTETGTTLVDDINLESPGSGSFPTSFTPFGAKTLFSAAGGNGYEPWATDGSLSGTTEIKDICTGIQSSTPNDAPFVPFGTVALFVADDCATGQELWATDGTTAGTKRVADINPGPGASAPQSIIDFGSMALFAADDGTSGLELYRTVVHRVPGAPTIGTATAGNGKATVSFTPPASNGGSPITGYTVTSTPGGLTATGAGSPITVTGLTNGVTYRFSVHATNAAGNGAESALSNAVTPTAGTNTITVVQPNGGEHIARGAAYTIKWTYTGSPGTTVRILLLKSGTSVQTIASSQAIGSGGAGQRSWTPPTSLAAAATYKIKIVVNSTSPAIVDQSNSTFSLT